MKKKLVYIFGGALGLILILIGVRFLLFASITSKLPEIPESHKLSEQVNLQISEARRKTKRNPSAENLGMLGMVYHSSANYEQAVACYELAIERDVDQWIWSYYLAYLSMELGESDAVLENFNRVLESHPENYLAWYYSGEAYLNLREYDQAEKYFTEISDIKKSQPGEETTRVDHFSLGLHARFQLAKIYFDSGRMELAEKTLQEIIQTNPRYGSAYRLLGNIYRSRGDEASGSNYRIRANDLMNYAPPVDTLIDQIALLSRSDLYLQKKIDEAINGIYSQWAMRLINNALQYIPDDKYLVSKAIKTCLWLDLDQQAISYTNRHLTLIQNDFNELVNTGLSFYNKEAYRVSIRYFLGGLRLSPGDKDIQKRLAIAFWNTGEEKKSLNLLEEVLEKNPNNMEILAEVADVMIFDLNQADRASVYLSILEQFTPSDPKVLKLSAWKAEQNGQLNKAISLYSASFKGDPEDLSTIKNLGTLLTTQKMWAESIGLFREALQFHSNEPYLLERLGTLLVVCPDPALKNIREGRFYLERAFVHTSGDKQTLVSAGRNLALACAMLGDKPNATRFISMTIALAKRENAPQAYLAELEGMALQYLQMSDKTVVLTQ